MQTRAGTAHPLHEAKYERLSIRFRQRSDEVEDRPRRAVVRRVGDEFFGQRPLIERLTPVMVGDAMARDGGEPAGKRRGLAQRIETTHGDEKHVLDEVVDVSARHRGQHQAVDHSDIAAIQLGKRRPIAAAGGVHDVGVTALAGHDIRCADTSVGSRRRH